MSNKFKARIPENFKDHPVFTNFHGGVNFGFMAKRGYYSRPEILEQPAKMAATGVNWVSLYATICQETFASTRVFQDFESSPTDKELINIINEFHANGIHVFLKPCLFPLDGAWMGRIKFPEFSLIQGVEVNYWDTWFASMTSCLKHYAEIAGGDQTDFEYGDLSMSTGFEKVSYQEYWYRGRWNDNLEVYWNDMLTPGEFKNRIYSSSEDSHFKWDSGLLANHFSLEPGQSRRVEFVLTWNIPNRKNDWHKDVDKMVEKNGLANRWKNWYSTQWKDSIESGRYMVENYKRLRNDTFKFRDTLFNSTLPKHVIDGVSANLAVLKSPTCLRLEDGTFYGWEGVGHDKGSCEGSCTHVWNYAQALPFLFPSLERSMREANYAYNVDVDGGSHFRIMLPLGIKAETDFPRPCVDGQFGDIMKTYRDWKICGDSDWLRKLWPDLKRTLEFAWSERNYDRWDPTRSGVITGRQHHTLDMELFGPSGWLNGHYLGALKAAAEMADVMGECDFAQDCREIFKQGKKWTNEKLFNGEYFFQQVNLNDKAMLEQFVRNDNDHAVNFYWNSEHREIKYQIGDGCNIDMHLPQWYASIYGIGEVF